MSSAAKPTSKPAKAKSCKTKPANKSKEKTHKLSLKGSAKLVAEFFEYSINSILFQRGVYPADDFTPVKKYGLNMLVSTDDQVKAYIRKIMSQLSKWMFGGKISKLVIVITSKDTGENLERWQFDVQVMGGGGKGAKKQPSASVVDGAAGDKENVQLSDSCDATPIVVAADAVVPELPPKEKTEKEVQEEIQSLFRQITASVTFLPMLDGRCTFNVLVYAHGDAEVPMEWGDSDAREIDGGEKVKLRSWGTSSHKVDTLVSYRLAD